MIVLGGVNMKKLWTVWFWGSGFLVSLAMVFVLFGMYWIRLTMYETLGYLTLVGKVNMTFGHFTLKNLAVQTIGHQNKKKKVE
jgi:Oligosaccharyltransferase subunit Ribophorin II